MKYRLPIAQMISSYAYAMFQKLKLMLSMFFRSKIQSFIKILNNLVKIYLIKINGAFYNRFKKVNNQMKLSKNKKKYNV